MHAKSPQLYPTLCDTTDGHLPGFSVRGFSRQEYWSELSCPPPGDLFDPRIETASPVLLNWQADALPLRDRYTDADVKIQTKMWVQIHR